MEQEHIGAAEESRGRFGYIFINQALVKSCAANKDPSGRPSLEEFSSPDFHEDFKIIKDSLVESGRQTRLLYEHVTEWNMRGCLNAGCQILHFKAEKAQRCDMFDRFDAVILKKLFQHGSKPDLVFLESAGSHTHGREIAKVGVPHVIAAESQTESPDGIRKLFVKGFYRSLFVDKMTVKEAFDLAVTTVHVEVCATEITFHLFPKDGNHEVRLFHDLPEGDCVDETPQLPLGFNLPTASDSYFGKIKLQGDISQDSGETVKPGGQPEKSVAENSDTTLIVDILPPVQAEGWKGPDPAGSPPVINLETSSIQQVHRSVAAPTTTAGPRSLSREYGVSVGSVLFRVDSSIYPRCICGEFI